MAGCGCYGAVTATVCPGLTTVMVPAHMHWHVAVWSNAGVPESAAICGGDHGVVVAGTHGAGPLAAITAGLVGALHIPNVLIFVNGTKSVIAARRTPGTGAAATWGGPGVTVSTDGVMPMSHII